MRCRPASALLALLVVGATCAAPPAREQREATVRYVHTLRNPDGGYRPSTEAAPSGLGTVVSGLRALKYFGGRPEEPEATARFVLSCFDRASGGFADTPGGQPTVRSTAMGLMALAELKKDAPEQSRMAVAYLESAARTPGEIYIAAAALDAAGLEKRKSAAWIAQFEGARNPDGSYGKGAADTASAVITILRLGGKVSDPEGALKGLRAAQTPEGGFAAPGEPAALNTTYPMMRAFWMLKQKPDMARLNAFLERCRNPDGGYGLAPGKPSTGPATYYAGIVTHWSEELGK